MTSPDRRERTAVVRLFEADEDLLRRAPHEHRERLKSHVTVPRERLATGEWTPPSDPGDPLAYLVLEGLLMREMACYGSPAVELLGPGDLVCPWEEHEQGSCEEAARWRAIAPAVLAVLDREAETRLGRIPGVALEVAGRGARRSRGLIRQAALHRMRGIPSRLLVLLWHLADRWGKRLRGEVVIELPLSQALLGDLVCADRSSINRAIRVLEKEGKLSRRDDVWTLHGPPPDGADLALLQGSEGRELVGAPE